MLDDDEIRRLLVRTAARDSAAFETLYRTSAPLMAGIALRIVGRAELAEEVVHDAYVRIWRAAASFDPPAPSAVAWMIAIVRHRAFDLLQSADHSRVDPIGDDAEALLERYYEWGTAPEDVLERDRTAQWLRRCLEQLDAAERQAIVLAYHHGLSHRDLAAHLARPLGTVKSWVRRGLASLRRCVEACAAAMR